MNVTGGVDDADFWWRIAAMLRVAHHVPGRIRLKLADNVVPTLSVAAERMSTFQNVAAKSPGIRSTKVNPLARSCVVEYDPEIISPSAWDDVVEGRRTEAAGNLIQMLIGSAGMMAGSTR